MHERRLTREEVRAFYDRFGRKQDLQRLYEGPVIRQLLAHGRFESALHVFELGCGTGWFAQELLSRHLPSHAKYLGADLSSTMVRLSEKKLQRFGSRARILQTDGSLGFDLSSGSFDRFVSIYVMDLLSMDDMKAVIHEAHRLLKQSGLVCLVSITPGKTFFSRLVMSAWMRIYRLNPACLGGCRTVELMTLLDTDRWKVLYHDVINTFGLSSEVLVAEKITH
jgi:ubiquinone/menaquinone biosynthesis C-methylase UbiE